MPGLTILRNAAICRWPPALHERDRQPGGPKSTKAGRSTNCSHNVLMDGLRLVAATARFAAVLVLGLGLAVAGCGTGLSPSVAAQSPSPTVRSPADTASDFLQAMGAGDQARMNADLVPARQVTDWHDRPARNVIDHVQCRPRSQISSELVDTPTNAVVVCDFDVLDDWSGFLAGHVDPWGVWLRREAPGPWLVYDWGVPV